MIESVFKNYTMDLRANIPIDLFKEKTIKPIDICLYIIIDQLSYKNGYCWATNKTIAATLNTCERTIQNSLNKLEKLHFIRRTTIKRNGMYYRNIYPLKQIKKEDMIKIDNKDYMELFSYNWLQDNI